MASFMDALRTDTDRSALLPCFCQVLLPQRRRRAGGAAAAKTPPPQQQCIDCTALRQASHAARGAATAPAASCTGTRETHRRQPRSPCCNKRDTVVLSET